MIASKERLRGCEENIEIDNKRKEEGPNNRSNCCQVNTCQNLQDYKLIILRQRCEI